MCPQPLPMAAGSAPCMPGWAQAARGQHPPPTGPTWGGHGFREVLVRGLGSALTGQVGAAYKVGPQPSLGLALGDRGWGPLCGPHLCWGPSPCSPQAGKGGVSALGEPGSGRPWGGRQCGDRGGTRPPLPGQQVQGRAGPGSHGMGMTMTPVLPLRSGGGPSPPPLSGSGAELSLRAVCGP